MKRRTWISSLLGVLALGTSFTLGAAEVGKPAPAFKLKSAQGDEVSLEQFKGKPVVLEWNNFDCPFVKKHYSSGNLPKLQQAYIAKGVVWLLINSAAEGKQGYLSPSDYAARAAKDGAKSSGLLLDSKGEVGKAYGAKTTPHMFVIDGEGKLVYSGALDSKATTTVSDIDSAENYVAAALDAVLAGKEVKTTTTQPYGCGVKY